MATQLWEIILVVISSVFNAFSPILIKKGVEKIKNFSIKNIFKNYLLFSGIAVYGLSYIISIPAFKNGDVSILYPFISLTYVWVSFFSVKFLGEKMNIIKWTGITLIIIGVSFIGASA